MTLPAGPDGPPNAPDAPYAAGTFPIVGVGASAGGLEAFSELLRHLPPGTGMGFVLVQHLDPDHESALAQILARTTALPVREVTDNLRVEPNHVYVIPPNKSLRIAGGVLTLLPRPQTPAAYRPIDVFFDALAEDQRERAIGVILSGTATDGTLGLEAIKAEGGITFAQDDSAKYESMPRSAVAAGCVDFVLSPEQMAHELARIATHPAVAGAPGVASPDEAARAPESGFEAILRLLHRRCGVDFSLYKSSTIHRRIMRRMVLDHHDTLEHYARFLREHPQALDTLYADALIGVTSFFRNPEAFEVLKRQIWPTLLAQRGREPLRAWVVGCSTGQEAYSVAMTFVEAAEQGPRMRPLQVFATDLSEALLEKARTGLYAKNVVEDVSPERLRRFFVEEEGGYRVGKTLREMVVFARQNLLSDPPFSRLDLISCRNLLIYLTASVQRRVFPVFHYALKPGAFLFLGASESCGSATDLFEPVDKKHRIYVRKAAPLPLLQLPVRTARGERPPAAGDGGTLPPMAPDPPAAAEGPQAEASAEREADRIVLNRFAPPAVLINADRQILQFRGPTAAYFQPPQGKTTFDVLKMARPGLLLPLRAAIRKAATTNATVRTAPVQVEQDDGSSQDVTLTVVPLTHLPERCALIVFEDAGGPSSMRRSLGPPAAVRRPRRGEAARRIAELETELAEMRDYLQSVQERHEAAHETIQASNEEVQSANEELQSINEELEASKEELESANEELTTVNEEMASRNAELNRLNSDLVNIQTSVQQAMVLVGRDLTVRWFSTQAEKQFSLLAGDIGRPFGTVRHQLALPDLDALLIGVIETLRPREREVQDVDGRWFSLRVRPYLTLDNTVDGAVLVLVDIDDLKRTEGALRESEERYRTLFNSMDEGFCVIDLLFDDEGHPTDYRFQEVNHAFEKQSGLRDATGRRMRELAPDHEAAWFELYGTVARTGVPVRFVRAARALGDRWFDGYAFRLGGPDSRRVAVLFTDVTSRRRAEEAVRESDRHKSEFLAVLAHELRNPLAPIRSSIEIIRRVTAGGSSNAPAAGTSAPSPDAPVATSGPLIDSAVEVLDRQVTQLVRLVDDLLDIGRISHGRIDLRLERVDVSTAVQHAAAAARPLCERLHHELTVTLPSHPVFVHADPARLAQIVGNLVDNACKFTEPGGHIWITVDREDAPNADATAGALASPPPTVAIRVRDTGIGISAGQLPRVFEMFTQTDTAPERSRSGLGIGLTLVKTLVQMHGGTVSATSGGAGRGSEFVVRLPIAVETPTPAPRPATPGAPDTRALRLLVVDDNRDAADGLALLLRFRGHETHTAYSGLEALEAAMRLQPDAILLDIGLPGLNGYETARRIRAQQGAQRPILVAVTGWGQDDDRRRSTEAGFDAHLVKPVDDAALVDVLVDLGAGTSRQQS